MQAKQVFRTLVLVIAVFALSVTLASSAAVPALAQSGSGQGGGQGGGGQVGGGGGLGAQGAGQPSAPRAPEGGALIRGAVEAPDFSSVTLPLFKGTSQGQTVYYIVTESSDSADAQTRGVNYAPKLNNARGTSAVQIVSVNNGVVDFPATVDFAFSHVVTPGPTGFPPDMAIPGPVGQQGYSPLIQLPSGIVLNASHVQNNSGHAPKATTVDTTNMTVTFVETTGGFKGAPIHYISVDSSSPVAAALENVTYAPALDAAPAPGAEDANSARAPLAAFVNGQTGATNPQHQGLNSALLDGLPPSQDPLNVLSEDPPKPTATGIPGYSPLWDVNLAAWSPAAVAAGQNLRQSDFKVVQSLAAQGKITSPDGSPLGPAGFIVDCPVISE